VPLKSQSQRRFLWLTNPELARRFEDHTPKGTELPDHVKTQHKERTTEKVAGLSDYARTYMEAYLDAL
jgi:hypothetical protein